MLVPNEEGKVKLYFTEGKVCIGSYDEITKYERETNKSYWASEFFELPLDYNPVGKTVDELNSELKELFTKKQLNKFKG